MSKCCALALQMCLFGGLQRVTDDELPLLTSDFYAKHMLPAKPEGKLNLHAFCHEDSLWLRPSLYIFVF